MTYFNIAIIITLVLFNLIMLKFVWIILKSENVSQLEAAVTSFVLIAAAVVMSYTSVVTVVYADDQRNETKYMNGHMYGDKSLPYTSHRYKSKFNNKSRGIRPQGHRPKLIHKLIKR